MQALWPGGPVLPLGIVVFVLGATVGSFLNVVIARLPEGQSVVQPGSRCPTCRTSIRFWQNIPLLSWVALRGRCAFCRAPISLRYPMVELLTGFLFLASYSRFGWSWGLLSGAVLSAALVVITFIDIDIWEIPDEVSIPGMAVGAALRPLAFDVPWHSGLVGAALGAAFLWFVRWAYFVVRKTEGMGLGDVKLIAMIGAFLGAGALLPTVLVGSVAGTVAGVLLHFVTPRAAGEPSDPEREVEPRQAETTDAHPRNHPSGRSREEVEDDAVWVPPPGAVPFGPFLAIGALSQLLFAPAFARLYTILWGL